MPYINKAFPQTHPDRLAALARVFGVTTPDVETCRVLELGCASGDNLIPMALGLPNASFLGIDFSRPPDRRRAKDRRGARTHQHRPAPGRHRRRRCLVRHVRLHRLPRNLFVGAGADPRKGPGDLQRKSGAAGRRVRQLQHVSGLADPRNDPGHDALSLRARVRCAGQGSAKSGAPAIPGAKRARRHTVRPASQAGAGDHRQGAGRVPVPRPSRGHQRAGVLPPVRRRGAAAWPPIPRRGGFQQHAAVEFSAAGRRDAAPHRSRHHPRRAVHGFRAQPHVPADAARASGGSGSAQTRRAGAEGLPSGDARAAGQGPGFAGRRRYRDVSRPARRDADDRESRDQGRDVVAGGTMAAGFRVRGSAGSVAGAIAGRGRRMLPMPAQKRATRPSSRTK